MADKVIIPSTHSTEEISKQILIFTKLRPGWPTLLKIVCASVQAPRNLYFAVSVSSSFVLSVRYLLFLVLKVLLA